MAIEVERMIATLEANFTRYDKALNKALGNTDRTFKRIEHRGREMENRIAGLGAGIGRNFLAGLGASATAALAPLALFQKTLEAIDEASHLVETADKIGITTAALQELTFGFSQFGVERDTFEKSMEQFSKRIGEAATKGGDLANILKANGVELRNTNGEIRPTTELLREYANLIANAATEQERAVLANEAFGRSGADMVLALQGGAEAIDGMAKAAADAGGVLDDELLRKAEEIGDRFDAMWRRFEIRSQEAILTAVDWLDRLSVSFSEFNELRNAAAAGAMVGAMVDDPAPTMRSRLPSPVNSRIDRAFAGDVQTDAEMVQLLRRKFGRKTVLPPGGTGVGSGGRRTAERETDPWDGLRKSAQDYSKTLDEINRRHEEVGEIGGAAVGKIVNAFADGKLEAEELLSIVAELVQELLRMPSGGLGGSGGGFLSGLLSSIFHAGGVVGSGGSRRMVSPLAFAGAPRMHAGGVAGLRPDEVPAILQRGEVVLPKNGGRAAPAAPQAVTISVNVEGASGDDHIVKLVQQGVAMGLSRYDKTLDRTIAGKVVKSQAMFE